MKIKDVIKQTREEAVHKLGLFFKAESELMLEVEAAANGFFNPDLLKRRELAYKEWQEAENRFNGILSFCAKQKLDPEMELSVPKSSENK